MVDPTWKWDIVENIVESVEEQEVLQCKREYPYDHKMGHKGFVNKVGRVQAEAATTAMVSQYSLIDYESGEMEGWSYEPYM